MPREASTEENKLETNTPRRRAAPKKVTASKAAATKGKAVPKKVVRKPAVKKTVSKKPTQRKTLKKTEVTPIQVEEEATVITMSTKTRKAPTILASSAAERQARKKQTIVVSVLLIVGIATSAVVGFTDTDAGQINVAQTIKDRNDRMATMVDVSGPAVVANSTNNRPDGGFIGLQPVDPTQVVTPAVTASTTAATSTASTSDAVGEETDSGDLSTGPEIRDTFATDTATTTVIATTSSAN